jgi:putative ABC transport system ATP-binding protein
MNIIELRDLAKSYIMDEVRVDALMGVSFTIAKGEYVAITGRSGSGKSTLLNLLGCLDVATSGTYKLSDVDVSNLDDNALSEIRRDRIGFVFQSFNLIPRMSVTENIEMPLFYKGVPTIERRERAMELADRVGIGHRVNHRPSELSGGERQRVAVARALANDPDIILADEPTGNLDSKTGREILGLFQRLSEQGANIILVTHDPQIAQNAPRQIHLSDGTVESDTLHAVPSPA